MAYSPEFREALAKEQDTFVWQAPDTQKPPRTLVWYLVMTVIGAALIAYAAYTNNYLFAFIILLVAVILVLAGNEPEHPVLVQIGPNGVVYDGRMLFFDELSQFAILYQPPELKILYIQPQSSLTPRLRINLDQQDPVALRAHLKRYLDEDLALRDEHVSDIFGRLLRL